jgi:serine/threonine protein kinase
LNRWAHNDVKPGNFLFSPKADGLPEIKLSDLGFACTEFNDGGRANKRYIDHVINQYKDITGAVVDPSLTKTNVCERVSTAFFQMPKWDAVPSMTSDTIKENYENDVYCFVMSIKLLFLLLGFDRKAIDRSYRRGVWAAAGNEAKAKAQLDAWTIDQIDYGYEQRAKLRAARLPYEFLLDGPFRNVVIRFAKTLQAITDEGMTAGEALGYVAEEFDDALEIAGF